MVELTEEQRTEISGFLQANINSCVASRKEKMERIEQWRILREGEREEDEKNYPFPGASNIPVPITAITVNTAYGKTKSTFEARNPFWMVKALKDDPVEREQAEVLTKHYRNITEGPMDLNLRSINKTLQYEAVSLGTCFVKVPWTRFSYSVKEEATGEEREMVVHDGPEVVPIRYEDFLYPEGWESIAELPWCAHVLHFPEHIIKKRLRDGVYDVGNDFVLEDWSRNHYSDAELKDLRRRGFNANGEHEVWDIYHVFMYYDVDGDGVDEDLEISFHLESGRILAVHYNELGIRPFENMIYMFIPHSIEGRGVCQMAQYMDEEATTHHNMRVDNAHIVTNRMWAVKRTAGIKPREKIFPGKIFFVDNPREDIMPLQANEIPPSSLQSEQVAVNYAQRHTGMNDIMGGFPDQQMGSRQLVGVSKMQLDQGLGVLSSILEGLEDSYARLGMLIHFQNVAHREEVIEKERRIGRLTDREIMVLEEALAVPIEEVPRRMAFMVRTSDADETFDAKRQNFVTLSQLYTTYLEKTIPLAMQLFGPQGQQMLQAAPEAYQALSKAYTGSTRLMENIFKFFGEEDTEHYINDYEKLEMLQEIIRQMTGGGEETDGGEIETESVQTERPGEREEASVTSSAGQSGLGGGAQAASDVDRGLY